MAISLCPHVFAGEPTAQETLVVDRYVKEHKHWKKADYRIQRDRVQGRYIVFLVRYLPEEKRVMVVGGGETFEAFYDPTQHKVTKEMHFQ